MAPSRRLRVGKALGVTQGSALATDIWVTVSYSQSTIALGRFKGHCCEAAQPATSHLSRQETGLLTALHTPSLRHLPQSGLFTLFRKDAGLVPSKFRCGLMRSLVKQPSQPFACYGELRLLMFRIRKIWWLELLAVGVQIQLNEAFHG